MLELSTAYKLDIIDSALFVMVVRYFVENRKAENFISFVYAVRLMTGHAIRLPGG